MKRLRRYLVAGLLVWIPIGVTLAVVYWLVRLMDKTLILLPRAYHPENWLGFHIPGLGIILTLLLLLVTGLFAANFVGHSMVAIGESLLDRIPFVRSIYSGAKNFAEIVFSESNQTFKKVLLVEYPRKGVYTLAFQSATNLGEVQARTGEEVVCAFVPTTPNPTSGFIVMLPKDDVIELDMEVDAAIKMIVSLGVVVPSWPPDRIRELPLKMPPPGLERERRQS
ncbi:MAG TPA: DUF502 domain-containing protein [Woeseiaceae bacterium]|jgi:uncharacterized membrane protein|nr:DUF502 domain-containing protein [Woeseiaceae bacterium]